MSNELGLEYRPILPDELSLVLDSWLKSYQKSPWAGCLRNNHYFDQTRGTIEDLLARGAKLLAAVVSETQRVAGFICYETKPSEGSCVHYVYVKDPFRRLGVAKSLIQKVPEVKFYTFRTRASKFVLPGAVFAPEIARRVSF